MQEKMQVKMQTEIQTKRKIQVETVWEQQWDQLDTKIDTIEKEIESLEEKRQTLTIQKGVVTQWVRHPYYAHMMTYLPSTDLLAIVFLFLDDDVECTLNVVICFLFFSIVFHAKKVIMKSLCFEVLVPLGIVAKTWTKNGIQNCRMLVLTMIIGFILSYVEDLNQFGVHLFLPARWWKTHNEHYTLKVLKSGYYLHLIFDL